MFQGAMSNSTLSEEVVANNLSSFNPLLLQNTTTSSNNNNNNINNNLISSSTHEQPPLPKKVKKRRNLPGNPDPDAEVIALSPKSLLATNRFICEICNKGFQRDQNLQLHRRGHNLPWKLKQRNKQEIVRKKAYVCPEPSCVHHHPSRALGDLTGIKKHFCRKHGEKKFKCEKCSKIYAVHSDWKAHSKTCGTREYRCDCGTLFSRKDSFITHRAFCDALAEESARLSTNPFSNPIFPPPPQPQHSQQQQPMPPPPSPFAALSASQHPSSLFPFPSSSISLSSSPWDPPSQNPNNPNNHHLIHIKTEINNHPFPPPPQQQQPQQPPQSYFQPPPLFTKSMLTSPPYTSDTNTITAHFLSATALLQKATAVGATLQQSQQSQQAQSMQPMVNHGFDELGPSFCNVGQQQQPQSTTTTATTNVSNLDYHHHLTMGMVGSGDFKFATWRKDEDTTRDFLGLTAGDHYTPNTNTNTTTTNNNLNDHSHGGGGGGGGNRSEGGFVVNDDDDDMEGNMLKFTGGLQYGMTAPYDRDNSSPSSSSLVHHHHHHHHHGEGSFGNFVTSQPPTAAATSDSRWG